jgi:hypothetical protein
MWRVKRGSAFDDVFLHRRQLGQQLVLIGKWDPLRVHGVLKMLDQCVHVRRLEAKILVCGLQPALGGEQLDIAKVA